MTISSAHADVSGRRDLVVKSLVASVFIGACVVVAISSSPLLQPQTTAGNVVGEQSAPQNLVELRKKSLAALDHEAQYEKAKGQTKKAAEASNQAIITAAKAHQVAYQATKKAADTGDAKAIANALKMRKGAKNKALQAQAAAQQAEEKKKQSAHLKNLVDADRQVAEMKQHAAAMAKAQVSTVAADQAAAVAAAKAKREHATLKQDLAFSPTFQKLTKENAILKAAVKTAAVEATKKEKAVEDALRAEIKSDGQEMAGLRAQLQTAAASMEGKPTPAEHEELVRTRTKLRIAERGLRAIDEAVDHSLQVAEEQQGQE